MTRGRFGRFKVAVVLVSTSVLLALAVSNIVAKARFRLMDDGVFWESRNGTIIAKRVDPEGPAAAAGLAQGDVLFAMDGSSVPTPQAVQSILDGSDDRPITYNVLRLDRREALTVNVRPLPRGNVGLYYYLAGVGIFSLLVGTVVYVRRRGLPAVAHFYVLSLFWFLAFSFSFTGRLDFWDTLYYWTDWVGNVFFPALFLHFALTFPRRKALLHRRGFLVPLVYIPSVTLMYLILVGKLVFFTRVSWADQVFLSINTLLDRALPTYAGTMCILAFAALANTYRTARSITARKQTKWIVLGTGCGIAPFMMVYAVPYLLRGTPPQGAGLSVIPVGLIPLSFAYAIVRYRLMDVEVLFKRGVVYSLATATVIALYLAIFLTGTHYLVTDPHSTIIALLATMVVVLAFTPVKTKIQVAIDRMFYRESYDYRRALLAMSRDLNADLDLGRVSTLLVARIGETFGVERVALLAAAGRGSDLEVVAARGVHEEEWSQIRIASHSRLFARLALGESFCHDDFDRSGAWSRESHGDEALFEAGELQYAIPCLAKGEVVGVILLGRRIDQSALSSEDMELLLTVAGQAATALENARLYRSLANKVEQFERLKEHSDNVVESLSAGILVVDLAGVVVRWNRALEQLYRLPRNEAIGRPLSQLFSAPLLETLQTSMGTNWWATAEAIGVYRLNLENLDGERKVVKLQVAPFVSEGGETQGTIVIFEDVTERVELEQQLQLREKMASLGLLAAGVAHEVNTPLTGISSFTQMLRERTEDADPRARLLEKIERQTERASKIVNNLLNFARQGTTDFVPVDLNEVVADVLSLLEHQLERGRIKVLRELDPSLPRVLGDENKLQQVFLNLVLNAQDAMSAGGWLTLRTAASRAQVIAEVSDTGQGIDKEDIKRIYDPFFTTKKAGAAGTGLGLSISYGIVQEHSGTISVDSVIGKGTRFEIKIPAMDPQPARVETRRARARSV